VSPRVNLLGKHFGIRRLLLGGGGHINNALLQADLVDEVSLLLVPGIDGRREVPAVFDVNPARKAAVPLKLKSIERREKLRSDCGTTLSSPDLLGPHSATGDGDPRRLPEPCSHTLTHHSDLTGNIVRSNTRCFPSLTFL